MDASDGNNNLSKNYFIYTLFIKSLKKVEKSITWKWYIRIGRIKSKIKRNIREYLRNLSIILKNIGKK